MRVTRYMQIAYVSESRPGTCAWESGQTGRRLLIDQRLEKSTDRRPHDREGLKAKLLTLAI